MNRRIVYFAGGVGGSKLADGLATLLQPEELTVVVNTGDDEEFYGLHVSPDLDTMIYTLAGLVNQDAGWGLSGDTFHVLDMLERYGASTWFKLGDRDIATHITRTRLLRCGHSLSEVTRHLRESLGVAHLVIPMTDDRVRTVVDTAEGVLAFQDYFVRRACEPIVKSVEFVGACDAMPAPDFVDALGTATAIVYGPSNPLVSLGPILALPGVTDQLRGFVGPRIAVSPIVGGQALRGPAAKMLRELGEIPGPGSIARRLVGVCDFLVVDNADRDQLDDVRELGIEPVIVNTVMLTPADRIDLARFILGIT